MAFVKINLGRAGSPLLGSWVAVVCASFALLVQSPAFATSWRYTLVSGSQLIDDCPICDRLPIVVPMAGTFDLRPIQQGPLFSTYEFENIAFTAGIAGDVQYRVKGKGTFQIGGEVAVLQEVFLELEIQNFWTNQLCYLTNASLAVTREFPMLQIGLDQTNGTLSQQFHLDINAAPFREIWFSCLQDFKSATSNILVSAGDLISSAGRVVKSNAQLSAKLNIMPGVPDLGLKDVDVLPGGELAFSITHAVMSETLGRLSTGDVLSDHGRIVAKNGDLVNPFVPEPALTNGAGLAAIHYTPDGDALFSVETNFFSARLGTTVQRSDLLSMLATNVFRTGTQLLARFSPTDPKKDYGLIAVFVWPGGEIWFVTAEKFTGADGVSYNSGDLLSDQGYLVYRNAELLAQFTPQGAQTNYGLDAVYVISDVVPLNAGAQKTVLTVPKPVDVPASSLELSWLAGGRAFQVEKSTDPSGPFAPVSPIVIDSQFLDAGTRTNEAAGFYRLRQW